MRALVLVLAALAAGPALAKSKKAPEPAPMVEAPAPPPDPLAERPAVGPARPFAPPAPTVGQLSNGASTWTVVNDALPLFTVVLTVPGGSALDPAGKEGTSALAVECMQRGAGSRDAGAFASEVERRGLSLSAGTGPDGAYAVLSGTTDQLDAGLDLLADMVMRPKFAGGEVKKAKELLLAGLQSSMDEPAYVANRTAQWLYWGAEHPYGRPSDGTLGGVKRAGRGDIKKWHKASWHPVGARFTVVGAVDPAKVQAALEARFGAAWKVGKRPAVVVPPAPAHDKEPIYLVDAPGSSQTGFYLAFPGLPAGHAAAAPTRVGTIALGGTFTSRLNSLLREKRGYTYGVRAALDEMLHGGTLLVRTRIRADVTGAALVDLVGELDGIRKGISAEELGKAQGAFRQDIVESMETVSGTTMTFANLHEAGRAPDSLAADLGSVGSVSVDAVTQTMAPYDTSRAVIVLVGDIAKIKPQLEQAGFTKLSVVTPP